MDDVSIQPRQPSGTPTGGQFAGVTHAEATAALVELDCRPAPGTLSPVDVIDWPDKNKRRVAELRGTLERIGRLHGVVNDGFPPTALVLGSNKGGGKGGHFSPAKRPPKPRRGRDESYADTTRRIMEWRNLPAQPQIRVNTRSDIPGEESFMFLHEFGHRIDCVPAGESATYAAPTSSVPATKFASKTGYSDNPEAAEAFEDFLAAARTTPNIADAGRNFARQPGFASYHRSVHEVWARAYSQWAANRLGGDIRAALEVWQDDGVVWPDDEFEDLAPHVENVLRATGMMR